MKFSLCLIAVAAAAQDDAVLDDYVNMMMRQASSEETPTTDLDEAIQAKGHGHGPHGHWPHGHNPHGHNPHSHTPFPTPFPTPHPCDDGSHGCEKNSAGICYKAGGNQWTCGCRGGYWCSRGCSAPHSYHTCTAITASPTPYPTSNPTTTPTPAPTTSPTMIGVAEIDALKKCCEKEVALDASYILPLHTCAEVRVSKKEDVRKSVHKIELSHGLTNDEVVDWLTKNRCFHEDHDTHFPTPAPTPAPTPTPTPAPTPAPTAWPTFSQHADLVTEFEVLSDKHDQLAKLVAKLAENLGIKAELAKMNKRMNEQGRKLAELRGLKVTQTADKCALTCTGSTAVLSFKK